MNNHWKRLVIKGFSFMMMISLMFALLPTSLADTVSDVPAYGDITLGTDYTDLTASISFYHHRTDAESSGKMNEYIASFNAVYPGITVDHYADTDQANNALLKLNTQDWGDVMFLPASLDNSELPNHFMSFGKSDYISQYVHYANSDVYNDEVYSLPYMACVATGIVYNKRIWEEAGVSGIPATPEEFLNALKLVKENMQSVPLYTNYAAGWPMSTWDNIAISAASTGDFSFKNQKAAKTEMLLGNKGDGTGPYAVYNILYEAAKNGYIENDYTTTDWESSKGLLNRGEISCLVLGAWAYSQVAAAGDQGDDIAYMPFPITVDGKQSVVAAPDNLYAINKFSSETNQIASLVFVKWMIEKSGWSYDEGSLPLVDGQVYSKVYEAFSQCVCQEELPALAGEEDLFANVNSESELDFQNGGNVKIQGIIEAAATNSATFDDIMNEWNQKWNNAQKKLGIAYQY